MKKHWIVAGVLGLLSMGAASGVWAAAVVQSMSGDVRLESAGRSSALTANQRVDSGALLHTGSNGQVVLRFDDGQMAALTHNTSFKIDHYRYEVAKPENGSIGVSLLKGALRMITGLIGERNRSNFALRTPNATIGIRGTAFMVGMAGSANPVNPVYVSVSQGAVAATNVAGTASWAAGATGVIATPTTLGVAISAAALPAGIASSFGQLGGMQMAGAAGLSSGVSGASSATGASGAAVGATGATSAALGGISTGALAAGAVAVGVTAAVSSNASTSGTTGTTGTTVNQN